MGYSNYSDDLYNARVSARIETGTTTFSHDADVKAGKTSDALHPSLDPKGVTREARDSKEHPDSLAICVLFDVTGSMARVPVRLQEKLPNLMGLLLRKGYVTDPAILFGAIGDSHTDRVPLQVGQFESGLEMDDDLTHIYLEGQGGGSYEEGYELALYFVARHTVTDCWEKRSKRGYVFLIGDEKPYTPLLRSIVEARCGDTLQEDIPVERLIEECQRRYHVFFVIPKHTHHGDDPHLRARWDALVGSQNVLMLDDADSVCEAIAAAIGMCEGTVDMAAVKSDLKDMGATDAIVRSVETGLGELSRSTALMATGSGSLPEVGPGAGTERL